MTTNDRESELCYFKQIATAREMGLAAAKFALDNALPLQAAKAIEIAENRCAELTAQYQQQIATPQPAPAGELVAAVEHVKIAFNEMVDSYNATGLTPSMKDLRVAIEQLAAAALKGE